MDGEELIVKARRQKRFQHKKRKHRKSHDPWSEESHRSLRGQQYHVFEIQGEDLDEEDLEENLDLEWHVDSD